MFDPLSEDVNQALKGDIAERGLLNPILCTLDYTVIARHHRLKAALKLGLQSFRWRFMRGNRPLGNFLRDTFDDRRANPRPRETPKHVLWPDILPQTAF